MDAGEIRRQIQQYIVENFLFGDEEDVIGENDSFLDSGLIDSTGILELVQFLEESFEIEVEDQEMIPENLDSIACVTRYVESKLKALAEGKAAL